MALGSAELILGHQCHRVAKFVLINEGKEHNALRKEVVLRYYAPTQHQAHLPRISLAIHINLEVFGVPAQSQQNH